MFDDNQGRYPDFLVIGAQKAGTTWLFEHLNRHPQIWLPPIKELHYFDGLWPKSFELKLLERACSEHGRLEHPDFEHLRWLAKFVLQKPRDDAWYAELFAPAGDRCAGDITPAYSMLSETETRHAHSLMPTARIIFILRDPIDRIWSHFHFSTSWRHRGLADDAVPDQYIIDEMETEAYDLRTRYVRTIRNWSAPYGEDHLLLLFYEDLRDRPREFLRRVTDHLGLAPLDLPPMAELTVKQNETEPVLDRREAVDRHVAAKYLGDLEWLADRIGGHAQSWLERARQLAS